MLHTKPRARLLTLLAALIPLSLLAADGDTFTYTYEGQTISYTVISEADKTVQTRADWYSAGNNVSGTLILPQTVYNEDVAYTLTTLGFSAFENCTGLTSVTLPESVTTLGRNAFYKCSGLTSVTLPESLTSINHGAFADCSSLTSITLPESLTFISSHAFYNCSGLTSINLPESVTSIYDNAFFGCTGLTQPVYNSKIFAYYPPNSPATSYAIPQGIEKIVTGAFPRCSNLTSITIPESVTSIDDNAFFGCTGLTQPVYTSKIFAYYPPNFPATSYTIPQGIEVVAGDAFYDCSSLTSITFPESVTSIGKRAFSRCTGLKSITLPESVTLVGDYAFSSCSSLTSVTLPESLTSINHGTFSECTGLTSITIPESVTSIGSNAFYNCTGLTSITIPESVTSVGWFAFEKCSSLTYLSVPESVASIEPGCFSGCINLLSQCITPTYILNNAHPDNLKGNITVHTSLSDAAQNNQQNIMGLTPSTDYTIDGSLTINGISCPVVDYYTVRTPEVALTTLPGKAQDATTALLSAETNIGELEENVGFEWKQTNDITDLPTQTIPGSVSNGKLHATLSSLDPKVSYNYRPYLKCADGSVYYGDWATVSTSDAATAIEDVTTSEAKAVDYCNLRGERSAHPFPGLNIVRFSDGTTRKLLIK